MRRRFFQGSQRANQNAGSTAPLYFLAMKAFTSGLVSALASFCMASLSLLSGRATRKFTYGESLPSMIKASLAAGALANHDLGAVDLRGHTDAFDGDLAAGRGAADLGWHQRVKLDRLAATRCQQRKRDEQHELAG